MSVLTAATQIGFVNVTDRERAIAFYRDTLQLELVASDDFGDVFAWGAARIRMTAMPDHQPTGHPVLGWEVADVTAAVHALKQRGIAFAIYEGFGQDADGVWSAPAGTAKVAWFHDPDGNALSLSQP